MKPINLMKEWCIKFVRDEDFTEDETVVKAPDYTRAYLEATFIFPVPCSILSVTLKETA